MFLHLSVILSTGGGVSQHALGQTPPWADTPHRADTNTPPTTTAADGTHPTGMHSRFSDIFYAFGQVP